MREVTINGEPTMLVASPITPFIYEDEFKADMTGELLTVVGGGDSPHYNAIPKMAWAMAKCAKYPAPFPDFRAWIEQIGGWDYSDAEALQGVVLEAARGLFRGKARLVAEAEAKLVREAAGAPAASERDGDSEEGGTDAL